MRATIPICAAAISALVWVPAAAQGPDTEQLLALGTGFARTFFDGLANVVAEERYVQETTSPRARRVLRSDFYMVRYPGADEWLAFRDVFEVDGKPLGPRADRMMHLFASPPDDPLARAAEIAREGARYNIRDIGTVNNPLFAIAMLQPKYSRRFRFTAAGLDGEAGPRVHVLRFEEWLTPTLLRGSSNNDIPTGGRIWIDDRTGQVVRTELEVGQARVPVRVVTTFAFDEELGTHVPAEMRDRYPDSLGEIRGVATYGGFRRFQVRTSEEVGKPGL